MSKAGGRGLARMAYSGDLYAFTGEPPVSTFLAKLGLGPCVESCVAKCPLTR